MDNNLGMLIKKEREKRGWDQPDLASRMGVMQQTVSRWEIGESVPRSKDISKLAKVFSLDPNDLHLMAGRDIDDVESPLIPYLPLQSIFNSADFEFFCQDFVQALHPEADVHIYGRPGDKQEGIDIYAQLPAQKYDYQCKRHDQFGPEKIKAAVKKNTLEADHHYLLLARQATAGARKEMQNHPGWTLWDKRDISNKIRELPLDARIRIVHTYFPSKLKSFLGVDPSPWLTTDEVYKPLTDRLKLFSHGWTFVGRRKEQTSLNEFKNQERHRALLISGRGGIGKSRLLKEWVDSIGRSVVVRFLSSGVDIKPEDLDKLPTGPAYLIIDDAHDRSDLSSILAGVIRVRPETKLIISTRPYGIAQIKADLTKTGFSYDQNNTLVLSDLSLEDATLLSEEILKDPSVNGDVNYAKRIAQITKDCPFATVIGSKLVGTGQIRPDLLNNEKQFQEELLGRFYEVVTGNIDGTDPHEVRDLLALLATIQPFNPLDVKFQEATTNILGRPIDKTLRDMGVLEDAGVLLRRGTRLRIVPDLLADYIRASAAYNSNGKYSTKYADRVFSALHDDLATNLLVNVSQLDWRLSADGAQPSLLNEIWSNLKEQFKKAKLYERSAILEALGKVSYYQPKQALDFVQMALEEENESVEEEYKGFRTTYDIVINKIPPILRYTAYDVDYLPESLELLKKLAERDRRTTNPHPDHPVRVLQDLASIEPGKPGAYNEAVATHVLGWLGSPTSGNFSPFDVLDALLKTEGHETETVGFTMTMKAFKVRPEAVAGIRQKVVSAALKVVKEGPINEAMRALKTLTAAIHYPMGLLGQDITDEDRKGWDPSILEVLNGLKEIVKDPKTDPYISVEIRRDVAWHAGRGSSKTKKAAKEALAAIPTTLNYEISRAIVDTWGWTFEREDGRFRNSEAKLAEWRKQLVKKILDQYGKSLPQLIKVLEERIATLNAAATPEHSDAGPFLAVLMEESVELTELLASHLLSEPQSPLKDWFGVVVSVMAKHDHIKSLNLIKEALAKKDEVLTRRISRSIGWGMYNIEVLPEEVEIIKELAKSPDVWVRQNIVRAVKRFAPEEKPTALDTLLTIDITDSKELADEVLGEFEERYGTFKVEDLTGEQLKHILDQLIKCPSIDDYHISLFLSKVSFLHPIQTLKLLTDRVEFKENNEKLEDYSPLPYDWRESEGLRFDETPQYEQVLRKARDWASQKTDSWIRSHYGADLFKSISAGFDSTTLKVLEEWIVSADQHQLESAASLLSEADNSFVWTHQDFVNNVLQAAQKFGDTCYRRVCSCFHSSLLHGVRSGTPGQPFPQDIEQRDRSFEIMSKLTPGSPAYKFYKNLHNEAKAEIERHTFEDLDDLD